MSLQENLWSFGLVGLLLLALLAFRRFRRGTDDYREMRIARQRLPSWAVAIEKLTLYVLLFATLGILFVAFTTSHQGPISGATTVYAAIGGFLIAFPVAALAANGVSWIVQPLRHANHLAMQDVRASFSSANHGLLLFAAVSVPIGIGAFVLAIYEPWAR